MTPPRRRWLFSLRTLFVVVGASAILAAIGREFPIIAVAVLIAIGEFAASAAGASLLTERTRDDQP